MNMFFVAFLTEVQGVVWHQGAKLALTPIGFNSSGVLLPRLYEDVRCCKHAFLKQIPILPQSVDIV
jgi:hypothetical protein